MPPGLLGPDDASLYPLHHHCCGRRSSCAPRHHARSGQGCSPGSDLQEVVAREGTAGIAGGPHIWPWGGAPQDSLCAEPAPAPRAPQPGAAHSPAAPAPAPPSGPASARSARAAAAERAGRQGSARRAFLPPPEPARARGVRGERASGGGRNLAGQMPQGAAALPACRCRPCGPGARLLLGRRCPRRGVCTERVKVCVAGAAGAGAGAQAGPNACHFPGHWQRQPGAPEPWAGLPVLPGDLIG
ncbi:hypothetical protein ACRRTK_001290 [Alexandromys fortis]